MHDLYAHSRDILADDAISIKSFDTILPSYSEATVPPYTPAPAYPPQSSSSSSTTAASSSTNAATPRPRAVGRLPPVPTPQILSISQSNLPLRFNGPQSSPSHPWQPKIVHSSTNSQRKRRPGAELNIFFRTNKPPAEALAHGDTSDTPVFMRRSSSPRMSPGRSFDDEIRMRELDELTRRIVKKAQASPSSSSSSYRPAPRTAGTLRAESRLPCEEWDALAVEFQREEIVLHISELESQFQTQKQLPSADFTALKEEIMSFQTMLTSRRDDVSGILASQVAKLHEFKEAGVKVSHLQKNQIKHAMLSMKAEISFLNQRATDLEKFLQSVEICTNVGMHEALEDDSKNWDLYFEAAGHR